MAEDGGVTNLNLGSKVGNEVVNVVDGISIIVYISMVFTVVIMIFIGHGSFSWVLFLSLVSEASSQKFFAENMRCMRQC